MQRREFLRIVAVAGLACVTPHCQSGPLAVGGIPGETHLIDLAGRQANLPSDFQGKVLVIHFWVSSCSACAGEMETLESIYRHYPTEDISLCSVNVGDSRGSAERYLERVTISYPVLLDEQSATRKIYRIFGVPATYVLDRKGVVRFTAFGPIRKVEIEKAINSLLRP
jgi:thiol-disulfide isomerase/thioredoxin